MTLLTVLHANGAPRTAEETARSAVIYVARRGWHIDIGFDAADLQPPLGLLAADFPGVRYLFFGFGDEHYLLAKNRNAPVLLAALWPGRGMILTTGLKSPPSEAFGAAHVVSLRVTRAQLQAAEDFVHRSLSVGSEVEAGMEADGRGAIRPYGPGPYDGSLYFASKDEYSALHTCNTWAAEVLKASGLRVHSVGVVFAGQLWTQARRIERQHLNAAPSAATVTPSAASVSGHAWLRTGQPGSQRAL